MFTFKKLLPVVLFCFTVFFASAQRDSVKAITIDLGENRKYALESSADTQSFLDYLSKFGPLLALLGIWYQIRVRQKDDILKNQLDRLNRQISDFYGPLFTLYETGDQNFYIYIK